MVRFSAMPHQSAVERENKSRSGLAPLNLCMACADKTVPGDYEGSVPNPAPSSDYIPLGACPNSGCSNLVESD